MIICPCKECENHSAECHCNCKDYADFTKELKEIKKAMRKEKTKNILNIKVKRKGGGDSG